MKLKVMDKEIFKQWLIKFKEEHPDLYVKLLDFKICEMQLEPK